MDKPRWTISACLVLAMLTSFLSFGCGMGIVAGSRPNIDVLEKSLRMGQSTPADVAAALGEPNGKGRVMLPIEAKPRTMWSYYYEEGTLEDARRMVVFVYFDQDRYDGYMWYSSLSK